MDSSMIKSLAARYGFVFKKGLGQNFLSSDAVLADIADAAETDGEGVIEIGPGFGTLTRELAKRASKVVALEVDERLPAILSRTLSDFDNVKVITADVLNVDLGKLIDEEFGGARINVAANLPYYITTPIVTTLLEGRFPIDNIVIMVQKEVAKRITAQPGGKDYGAISVLCQYFAEPQIIREVSANLFVPPPKVDSAVLRLRMRPEPAVRPSDEAMFFRTVKAAFSQRRKTLRNCISASLGLDKTKTETVLRSCDIDPTRRGETLSLEEFAALSDELKKLI